MASFDKFKNLLFQDLSTLARPGALKAALAVDEEQLDTRLWAALEAVDEEGLRMALSLGADPARCSAQGLTPLHHAARAGNAALLQALLAAPRLAGRLDEPSAAGHSALSDAAAAGHTPCVVLLLAAGARVGFAGPRGTTVLHRAVLQDNANLLRTLHEAGANWLAVDVDGATPLDVLERVRPPAVASWRRRATEQGDPGR